MAKHTKCSHFSQCKCVQQIYAKTNFHTANKRRRLDCSVGCAVMWNTKQLYDEGSHVSISNCERANQFLPWCKCVVALRWRTNRGKIHSNCWDLVLLSYIHTHTNFTDRLPLQQLYALFTHWFLHQRSTTYKKIWFLSSISLEIFLFLPYFFLLA